MVDKPTKLKMDPRLVPSIKSIGTLRYMSMLALHDPRPDMFKNDCLVKCYDGKVATVTNALNVAESIRMVRWRQ